MSEVQAAISRNVGVLRAVRGLRTDESVASILGVSVSTVNKKMSGARKWNLEEVEALAAYFRIPPNRLLGDPSELLDPNLRATGTGDTHGSTSAYVSPEKEFQLIQFPQINADSPELDRLATVTPLTPPRRPRRSLAAAV